MSEDHVTTPAPSASLGGTNLLSDLEKAGKKLLDAAGKLEGLVKEAGQIPGEIVGEVPKIAKAATAFAKHAGDALQKDAGTLKKHAINATRYNALLDEVGKVPKLAAGLEAYLAKGVSTLGKIPKVLGGVPAAPAGYGGDLSRALDDLEAGIGSLAQSVKDAVDLPLPAIKQVGVAVKASKAVLDRAPKLVLDVLAYVIPTALIDEVARDLGPQAEARPEAAAPALGASKHTIDNLANAAFVLQLLQRLASCADDIVKIELQIRAGGNAHGALSGIVRWAAGVAAHLGIGGEVALGLNAGTTALSVTAPFFRTIATVFTLARLGVTTAAELLKE